jgi:hypothetical protein
MLVISSCSPPSCKNGPQSEQRWREMASPAVDVRRCVATFSAISAPRQTPDFAFLRPNVNADRKPIRIIYITFPGWSPTTIRTQRPGRKSLEHRYLVLTRSHEATELGRSFWVTSLCVSAALCESGSEINGLINPQTHRPATRPASPNDSLEPLTAFPCVAADSPLSVGLRTIRYLLIRPRSFRPGGSLWPGRIPTC